MSHFDTAHDRAAADDERGGAGGNVPFRFVDDAAEDCDHLIVDAPAARHMDLDASPKREHIDDGLGCDLRRAEVDLAASHHRHGIATDEVIPRPRPTDSTH